MKAIVCDKYGSPDVLRVEEVPKPVPGENAVLVKIHAASLNAYDWHLMRAKPFLVRVMGQGFLKPKNRIPGADIAGLVEAVGKNVTRFRPGDEVFGDIGHGGFAEYACAREKLLALKPKNVTYEEAAAVPMAAITALQGLRDKGRIRAGQKVLINGASGGVGSFAVQLARYFGANVTAVCSEKNMETARSLGADNVIDYAKEDFTKGKQRYDLILAANGYHSIYAYKRALTPGGIYVMIGGTNNQMFESLLLGPLLSKKRGRKLDGFTANLNPEDLEFLRSLLEAGAIKPVIDRRYPLSETAEAIRYLELGHAKGKVVISVNPR